jgi:hypothetical protein
MVNDSETYVPSEKLMTMFLGRSAEYDATDSTLNHKLLSTIFLLQHRQKISILATVLILCIASISLCVNFVIARRLQHPIDGAKKVHQPAKFISASASLSMV